MTTQPATPLEPVPPTQVRHPWRAVARTLFAALIAFAPMAPVIYRQATEQDPAQATGAVAVALGIAAGVTRVLALPAVEEFLRRFVPFLAAAPRSVG